MNIHLLSVCGQLLLLLSLLVSCSWPYSMRYCGRWGCMDGRRPQVMIEKDTYVLEFDRKCPATGEYREQKMERPCEEETDSHRNTCCSEEDSCIVEYFDGPLENLNGLPIRRPIDRHDRSLGEFDFSECAPMTRESVCSTCGGFESDCSCKEELPLFRFATGDSFAIAVEGEEEMLAEQVTVAGDGKIYYLFLNGLPVAGRTIPEVTEDLTQHLKKLFKDPVVTVTPTSSLNSNFTILGRVFNPGVYPIPGKIKLREAIGLAGGIIQRQFDEENRFNSYDPLPLANLTCSLLVRNGRRVPVDFHSLIFSADQTNNVTVYPGDYIYIAPAYNDNVFVVGNVIRPLRIPFQKGMSLIEALAISGGWLIGTPQSADISHVLVLRGPLNCPCVVCVNINHIINGIGNNVILMPGDIIFVPNKTLRFGRELVLMAINTFVQSFATSAGSYYAQSLWFNTSVDNANDNTNTSGN